MAISSSIHHNAKDLILGASMILIAEGAILIKDTVWVGVALIFLGIVAILIRGLYKKYLSNGEKKETEEEVTHFPTKTDL